MIYDIIVIGGGPAGLTAALYACRASKTVLVLEKSNFGGQITFSPKVENIPGFLSLSGNEFAEKLGEQALNQGAELEYAEVLSVTDGAVKTVVTDQGEYQGKAVIIATGAKHRLLNVPKEQDFVGEGISFCAVCDGAFYQGKTVAVVGGGNSALQEAILLSDLAEKVYVLQNLKQFTGEQKLVDQLLQKQNVEALFETTVQEFLGDGTLTGVRIECAGEATDVAVDGVFLAVGLIPQNEPFVKLVDLNDYGYAMSNESCVTRTKGIFVAGDCRAKKIRQVATAAADGAVAALAACDYVDTL